MLEQVTRLEDGDYEQSSMVQLFLACVDRTGDQLTAVVSCQQPPMHEDDYQSQTPRGGSDLGRRCNSCCHGELWRRNVQNKIYHKGLKAVWLHQKATTFDGVGTSTTNGKLKLPMAVKLEESGLIVPGCAHTHEMPDKSHLLLLSRACQATLGMVKSVRDVSISLDDYGG